MTNIVFFLSDEHTRDIIGCYGNPVVKTPNLDRLASRGTRYANAYCNSPLCVPSRASLATGRYVHQIRCWDNGHPFDGSLTSWGSRLKEAGHHVTAIGKLHYRDSRDENGFSEEIIPLHVVNGIGDLIGLIRKDPAHYGATERYASDIGAGETDYTEYDRNIRDAACDWLRREGSKTRDKPWVLFVSFVSPHFPLIAPQAFYDLYTPERMPWPRNYDVAQRPRHPYFAGLQKAWNYDDYFDAERVRIARTAYYGLCSFLDDNIGCVLRTLEDCGLDGDTRVFYSSDHGESLGNHGLWSTSTMYEESVGVPMLAAGPGIPENTVVPTLTSLVDFYPTLVAAAGEPLSDADCDRPGTSLLDLARGESADRTVFSEYHAGGSITGVFMIRKGRWKYIHYEGFAPQLFDLPNDPTEAEDLGESAAHADVRAACDAALREIVDPAAATAQAFEDQAETIERHGGVEAILERGDYGYSPAPGYDPSLAR